MAQASGIMFEKDKLGNKRYVRIDLKRYGKEIEPFLKKMSANVDDQFDRDWAQSLSPEQFKNEMHSRIKNWFEK